MCNGKSSEPSTSILVFQPLIFQGVATNMVMFQQNPWKNHLPDSKKAMNLHLLTISTWTWRFVPVVRFKEVLKPPPIEIPWWSIYELDTLLCSSLPPKLTWKGSSSNHPLLVSGKVIYFDRSSQIWRFHQPRFRWNKGISLTIHHH